MIISITRELGAGGLTVGEAVASALGARLLDERTVIGILSKRLGLSEPYIADTIERPRNLGEEVLIDLAAGGAMLDFPLAYRPTDEELIAAALALVTEAAQEGHVVVIGQGGPGLLRGFDRAKRFMILLHARRNWRIAEVAKRFGIDSAEAKRRVERVDKARSAYLERYFSVNMYEARDYDLVLNTEFLGLETAAAMAAAAAKAVVARGGSS